MISLLLSKWRLAVPIILIACLSVSTFYYKTRYASTVSDYRAYKANIMHLVEMRKLENEILRKQAESSVKQAETIYDNNLKAIKNEYLKKQKMDSVTIGDLRVRLRDQIRADTFTVSEAPADTSATTEEWRDSYRAIASQYQTLVDACSITTLDYNLLRDWADISCLQVGCEGIE